LVFKNHIWYKNILNPEQEIEGLKVWFIDKKMSSHVTSKV